MEIKEIIKITLNKFEFKTELKNIIEKNFDILNFKSLHLCIKQINYLINQLHDRDEKLTNELAKFHTFIDTCITYHLLCII